MRIICCTNITRKRGREQPGPTDSRMAYVRGLQRLGHDVFVVEEDRPKDYLKTQHDQETIARKRLGWKEVKKKHFQNVMESYSIWPHCCLIFDGGDDTFGLPMNEVVRTAKEADLLLDIGSGMLTEEVFDAIQYKAYIDRKPGKTQTQTLENAGPVKRGAGPMSKGRLPDLRRYDLHFSVAHNIGRDGSLLPDLGLTWHGTFEPVVLEMWHSKFHANAAPFTTVTSWKNPSHGFKEVGEKKSQWKRFFDLPSRTTQELEVAVHTKHHPEAKQLFEAHGWSVHDANRLQTLRDYQTFIERSRAEFSVTNNRYVELRTAWASERSARYLASGKPILIQSTGIEAHIPTGKGLLTFSTMEEALEGIEIINHDYLSHCRAARLLAEEYFDSDIVLTKILKTMGF